MFNYNKGIKLNNSSLWLDSGRIVDECVVSHAHLDHARKHKLILATDPTVEFLKRRLGKTRAIRIPYREPLDFAGVRITLYPAGHILGSAQILVESAGQRLLYSGDFNMEASATAEAIEIPKCDTLIMESTFGRPRYRFPRRTVVIERLCDFVTRALREDCVPVVAGYTLGKAQEAMKILGDAGFRLSVHGSVAALARIYERYGIDFGHWQTYKKLELEGSVLIVPRIALRNRIVKKIEKKRVVFLTGWAVNGHLPRGFDLDAALPLSDHADFDGLIEYARQSRASKIFTTHGFREFPQYLRAKGLDAVLLTATRQLSLF